MLSVIDMHLPRNRQRDGHPLHHATSYPASFRPEHVGRLLDAHPGRVVGDRLGGRGTVLVEGRLRGRTVYTSDLLETSVAILKGKATWVPQAVLEAAIDELPLDGPAPPLPEHFACLYDPVMWPQVWCLRRALLHAGDEPIANVLRMLALGRLHGGAGHYFSVPLLPGTGGLRVNIGCPRPDQLRRTYLGEANTCGNVKAILKWAVARYVPKEPLPGRSAVAQVDARNTKLPSRILDLLLESPPFLDSLDHSDQNWVRQWFVGCDAVTGQEPYVWRSDEAFSAFLGDMLLEAHRILKLGGILLLELGFLKANRCLTAFRRSLSLPEVRGKFSLNATLHLHRDRQQANVIYRLRSR